jgi:hypothetical protein
MLVGNASAFPPANWEDGDEVPIFGHSFEEEYWTNESIETTSPAGDNVTFSASFVNYENVSSFLFSLNTIENANGVGTVPFQLFGLHYWTPENREVFIGAVLAFLMAFQDDYNGTGPGSNGLPDPGHEPVFYIVPFGLGNALEEDYAPDVNVQSVQKLGEGHYRFGIQYLNLYAFVSQNFVASAVFNTGYIAKFSELTVTYEVTMDLESGEVRAETWYTLGEVTNLWAFIFGIPVIVDPHSLPANMGISVVHFVTVFTSKYVGPSGNTTGTEIDTGINAPLEEDIVLKVGDLGERAMKIGTRGTFDLIDEGTDEVLKEDEPAMNAIIGARLVDLVLVAWQLSFSAGIMSVFAYALSDYVQESYDGPLDLATRSLIPTNEDGFNAYPLWYAVSFPEWNGHRVVHDPVYTAYTSFSAGDEPEEFNPAGLLVLVLIVVAVVAVVAAATRKKKGT